MPFNLTQGSIERRFALEISALQSSKRVSMNASRSEKKKRVFAILAFWTLLKAPRPEVFRQASLQVPAHGQTFPTPERVEGDR